MNEQDKKILENQKQQQIELGKKMADFFNKESGFNSDSTKFRLGENSIGDPILYFPPNTNFTELLRYISSINPDMKNAKYESNYLLDSDYSKEVIWWWENGKRKYMEVSPETKGYEAVTYDSIESVANAIRSANPTVGPDMVFFESDSRVLKIAGHLGDIMLPPGLKIEDNKIVVPNNPNLTMLVEKVRAEEITKDDNRFGTDMDNSNNTDVKSNSAQQGYNESSLSKDLIDENTGATIQQFGTNLFNFENMQYVNKVYQKDELGQVTTRETDGVYVNMSTTKILDMPIVEATLELNEVWREAYYTVVGGEEQNLDDAFKGNSVGTFFNSFMNMLQESPTKHLGEILTRIFEGNNAIERIEAIKIMAVFASSPRVARCYGLEGCDGVTPNKVISYIDNLANEKLKRNFDDMMDDMSEGMQMKGPKPNN